MATSKSKLAIAKNIANKVKTPKRKKVSAERYISQGQNPPQSKAYTEVADEGVGAKPIGYRWTKVGATRLSKNEKVKPSKEDVLKYKNKTFKLKGETHRYLYSEKRVDKSDRSIKAKFAEGGTMARGGGVKEIDYSNIYPILKDKIDNAVDDISYENVYDGRGEEVEHKSRSGFIAYTDGGYEYRWFEYVSIMNGSGKSLPTKPLDDELDKQVQYNYDIAKETFIENNPQIAEELGEDKITYSDLQDAGYELEAEELSELEMDFGGEDSILMRVFAHYYSPENSRSKDGKQTISLFGDVNLESPYHRAGNLDDSMEITFTFTSLDDLSKKMDTNLKKIVGWFEGDYYKKSNREMKVRRMAEGGSIKQSRPQSKVYKRSADRKVEAKPVGWRYKGNNYNEPSDNVIKRETAKPRNERKIYFEKRKDKSDYDFFSKLEYGGEATQGAGSFKKGGYTQSGRQSPNYNEAMDGQKMGKPVGYRFTDRLAKRLGVNPHSRPTDAQIDKYLGRGVYFEAREDKSDIKPSKKYISLEYGGEATEGAGSFKKGGYTQSGRQSPNYNEAMDGQKMGKPVGYRFTDRLAKRLGVNPHIRPTDAQIEKYLGRGVYFEAREDKSDNKPSKKYISLEYGGEATEGAGSFARGGSQRIANIESRTYTENMIPFKGSNLEGKTLDNGDYVVLSYGYYPIWWYCKSEGKWYGNSTKYSVSTSKQMSQSRPTYDATMLTRNELEQTMMKHSARFEDGGMLDGLMVDTNVPMQNVGGTTFSTADLTPHMDLTNPSF